MALEFPVAKDSSAYDTDKLVSEIMSGSPSSPKVFVINLPEADVARSFCTDVVNVVFRYRKTALP